MKNEKLPYVLLPAVVIIWLVIGYRFYQAAEQKEDIPTRKAAATASPEAPTEMYALQLDYPDPFLKKEKRLDIIRPLSQRTAVPGPIVKATTSSPTSSGILWESLAYHGMIENSQTTHRVGILTLNGVRKLMKEGEQLGTFTVKRILKDSVQVSSDKEMQYIIKEGKINWLSKRPR